MSIKRIKAKNFKSFKELDVELGNLNILIGANASGKSNFVEIFKFLRDIKNFGLENAISLQGGVEYLRNVNIGPSKAFSLEVISDREARVTIEVVGKRLTRLIISETIYKFVIKFEDTEQGFAVVSDELTLKCNFVGLERLEKEVKEIEEFGSGKIVLSSADGKLDINLDDVPEGVPIEQDMFPSFWEERRLPYRGLLLESEFSTAFMTSSLLMRIFDNTIYDFDPKLPQGSAPITGKAELEENGSNLAIVLKNILESEDGRRKFLNLITYLLPFVDDLDVERSAIDKSLLLKLRETYSEKFLPASLVSDGTINMIALVIALYFGKKPVVIIEEPERNIHPHLISKVVHMMEDASSNKQIIVTTHNPEMIKHADPKDILLVSRDKEGFSSVSKPSEKKEIKIFLENEVGIEELYVDNLLEI